MREESEKWARDLLGRTAESIEPARRWEAIRGATERRRRNRRSWWVAGGTAVAVAAVVTVVALVARPSSPLADPEQVPPGGATPSMAESGSPEDRTEQPTGETVAAPAYYVGDTPQGPRLFREFIQVPPGQRLLDPVRASVAGAAGDPDYRSLWPTGSEVVGVSFDGNGDDGLFEVTLDDPALRERPAEVSEEEAELAVQQLVYTVQGDAGVRAPVAFYLEGEPLDQVLGVPLERVGDVSLAREAPILETLSRVSLSDPMEGLAVTGDVLAVRGAANAFEANVVLTVSDGDRVVLEQPVTASGWMGEKLFGFSARLDVGGLPDGTYTLTARVDDPTDEPEVFTDTRTFVVDRSESVPTSTAGSIVEGTRLGLPILFRRPPWKQNQ